MEGRTEGFQFSPETLRSFSRYYREHPTESVIDGYEKNSSGKIIRRANEKAIGRNLFLLLFFIMFNVYSTENVIRGQFEFKVGDEIFIRYVKNADESISLVSKYKGKDCVIDNYSVGDGAPTIESVFFVNLSKESNVVSLVSWDEENINAVHYKAYIYKYTSNGAIKLNEKISSDKKLEGYDGYNGSAAVFELKNSRAIRSYLKKEYDASFPQ
ncbi:hypothetical protein FS595_08490 [Serratia rubidaea]|uniref:hypothetical protein n=1 Tax=Serratia rubidaea TaxID=61652 RepID=UPI001F2A2C62|nr:hypothetical protein [Serratia rubidaea]UJD79737.1 hypothetical protein FS596_08490 [Serratia rubidaea]UJD84293.1 hypothetical protein FS595_08490 [Serratia rubidaea]